MPIDPRLSLAVQPVDVQSAIAGGLANRQTVRESGIRERILGQQEAAGAQSLEQNRRAQALQTADFTVKLFEGLKGVPLDQRAAIVAQQLPQLEAMGLPAQQILATDLTDRGIDQGLAALKPLVQKQQATPGKTGVGDISLKDFTAESVQAFMDSGQSDFSTLKRLEKWSNVTLPDGTRAQINSITGEVRFPSVTESPADEAPVVEGAPVKTTLTPKEQIASKVEATTQLEEAKADVAVTEKVETTKALADVEAETQEAKQAKRKANQMTFDTVRVLDQLLVSERLDDITGVKGGLITLRPKTKDLLNSATQLSSLLTQDNLEIMSGVLSETDMGIIRGISNDLGFEFNKKGDVTGFSGSFDGTVKKMKRIKGTIVSGLNAKGIYVEGQTATAGGQTITFTGGQWLDADGNPIQ